MKHTKLCTILAAALVSSALFVPSLEAQTCAGNGEVFGPYGYFGSRGGVFFAGALPPGTTAQGATIQIPTGSTNPTTPVTGSNTPFGRFVTGLANNGVLSTNGRIYFDGAGGVYAASSSGSLLLNTLVGSYTVNSDCSIKITLNDAFMTTTPGETSTAPSVTLEGQVVDNRIDAVVTGANAAGASVTFLKTAQASSCSNANIQGNYSITGFGFGATTTTTPGTPSTTPGAFSNGATGTLGTPFSLLGRFSADGNGNLVAAPMGTSPHNRTLTGTYTVNVDCTGTARFTDNAGVTRNASFVLVNDAQCVSGRGASTNPSLQFVFTDAGFTGNATATRQ
jgi:hypothetical protein